MKCCKCGRMLIGCKTPSFPIDPKGTPGRRWACMGCLTPEQLANIPVDVMDLVNDIQNVTGGQKVM